MAFSDEEIARYSAIASAFCERKVPVHVHHQVWIGFKIKGQSIALIEYRVHWKVETNTTEHPIAQTTYNRKTEEWRLYWMRADLKWHGYQPCPSTDTFEKFLEEMDLDACGCFFG